MYLSPWDRNAPVYGDSPRYNEMYRAQLTELLTNYGEIHEVWFDGANGEGPNGRRQEYDWPRVWGLVRRLQPARRDVFRCRSRRSLDWQREWLRRRDQLVCRGPGRGPVSRRQRRCGEPDAAARRSRRYGMAPRRDRCLDPPGLVLSPGRRREVSSPPTSSSRCISRRSGRNSKLLLNVPPDARRIAASNRHRASRRNATQPRLTLRATISPLVVRCDGIARARGAVGELDLGRTTSIGVIDLAEDIAARSGGGALSRRGIGRRSVANAVERHHDRLPETRSVSARVGHAGCD